MAFLFKSRKSPSDLVKATRSAIETLDTKQEDDKSHQKAIGKLRENLHHMKIMLYGDQDQDPKQENINKLVTELLASDLLLLLLNRMKSFTAEELFEARKDIAAIFNFLLRRGQHNLAVEYVLDHPQLLQTLVEGYNDADVALNCGSILREALRHEPLCKKVLESPYFFNFFKYVQKSSFDVASDAFASLKDLLTKHKNLAATYLDSNYDKFFPKYNQLIQSKNYVTKRQSLKLLGEILLDRKNFNVMIRYINDAENLKIMMVLLKGKSKTISFEAFHVFKVFVANPQKSKEVLKILVRNKEKLIDFLHEFQRDKAEDEQLAEEKNILLVTLGRLDAKDILDENETEK